MRVAQLEVGERTFALAPSEVEDVMAAAATARDRGEWLEISRPGGRHLRMLIPRQALVVVQEYEVDDADLEPPDRTGSPDPGERAAWNDWAVFDYDV